MKQLILSSIIAVVVFGGCTPQQALPREPLVSSLLAERRYTFEAQSVVPTEDLRYNPRVMFPNASAALYQLSSGYDLRVTPDSVTAYLPFYGRAYTAPINPAEGGIKFTSTNFSYKQQLRKKNFEIEILPRDQRDVQRLYLTVSPGGFASLRVISLNKSPITFNGNIRGYR